MKLSRAQGGGVLSESYIFLARIVLVISVRPKGNCFQMSLLGIRMHERWSPGISRKFRMDSSNGLKPRHHPHFPCAETTQMLHPHQFEEKSRMYEPHVFNPVGNKGQVVLDFEHASPPRVRTSSSRHVLVIAKESASLQPYRSWRLERLRGFSSEL